MIVVLTSRVPSNAPQPGGRRFRFGLRTLLLFMLIAGPLLAIVVKSFMREAPRPLGTSATSGSVHRADGTPVIGATVSFAGTGSRPFVSSGTTQADGTFALSTFDVNDGAVPGDYSVDVVDMNGKLLL